VGWDDDNAIYWFSLLTLFFQSIFAAIFLLQLRAHSTGQAMPWWWETFKALPLAVQAFWMFAMGLIDWMMDKA